MLEEQLAKLEECSTQEKGEVMGDILKVHWGSCSKGLNGKLVQLERAAGDAMWGRACCSLLLDRGCGAEHSGRAPLGLNLQILLPGSWWLPPPPTT